MLISLTAQIADYAKNNGYDLVLTGKGNHRL